MQPRTALAVCLCLLTAGAAGLRADEPQGKLDAALRAASTRVVRVIVTTQPGSTDEVANQLRGRGRSVLKKHAVIHAFTAEVPVGDLAALESDPLVANVSIDADVWSSVAAGSPDSTATPLLTTLGLPSGGLTGNGVGVAVIDSGVEPNGDLFTLRSFDFTGSGPFDDYGHGTHLAGLIASRGTLSRQTYPGIAPRAHLINLKVLDANGRGATSTVIEAVEFAIVNRTAIGIDVINLSLGHPIFERAATDPLVQAVEAASRAGIVVVVAAGNVGRSPITGLPGYAGILSPGNAPSAITVGAVDTKDTASRVDDAIPSFSSRGPTWLDAMPKPDVVAPGQALVSNAVAGSTLFTQYPDRRVAGLGDRTWFLRLNGTSMSAAVASGTVALIIEAARAAGGELSPQMIKTILEFSAIPVPYADRLTQGHGALNAAGAIALTAAIAADGSPAAPVPVSPRTTISGETWIWAQSSGEDLTVVWGNNDDLTVVWGNTDDATVVWGNNDDDTVVWGNIDWDDTVVWGNIEWDETVVWGNADTLTWNNTVVWGSTVVWGNADITR